MSIWGLILALLICLGGCIPRQPRLGVPVTSPQESPARYTYLKIGEIYHVLAANDASYESAKEKICGQNICADRRIGEVYELQVTPPEETRTPRKAK